ncbi:MAG: D-alanyl-D-alanine carboxypeptidase/D-alanyl-D-alanine-endopeptidase [Fibromonadaceae bacterium]|jgi:D-alanyl-D-alanine carboxypeptidase/D-alanyl-D-alanine-endopeptidase (penicillin-binding protein 4)|nr:D-alanyl-D-alanine carboxypeptidase/D-alanyl-D-alanine-endopeptidase [Fibromonadaceae bacterium]
MPKVFFYLLLATVVSAFANPFLDSLVAYADSLASGARLGVSVRSVKTDSIVYSHKGNEWFTPASTQKLLTTAAAIETIPLNYAPKTLLHLEGVRRNNVFSGYLRIEGRGDPNISARYYPNALFFPSNLTDSLRGRGIDTLRGILDLDTSFFRGPRKPPQWRARFFDAWYGAEISSISFNDNCVLIEIRPGAKDGDSVQITLIPDVGYVKINNEMTTGGRGARHKHIMDPVKPEITFTGTIGAKTSLTTMVLPVRNPPAYFKAAFLKSLEQSGIVYIEDKNVLRGKALDSVVLAGPPLKSLLDEINQRSQNMHAEALLRILGQYEKQDGSVESGILAQKLFLKNAGLPVDDFKIADGSGLSAQNSLKPNSLTRVLTYMKKQKEGDIYVASLAIPGVSGGGKRVDVELKDDIRFKTGFIEGVHGLAGYIAADGDTLAFAVYLNNAQRVKEATARDLLDTLVGRIAKRHNSEVEHLEIGKKLWQDGYAIKNIHERINYFANRLRNKPYFLGPTGEGMSVFPSYKPRVNFNEMDCVTYIEHVLALAYAKNYDDFFNILQNIRYKNGVIEYNMRNHFLVADWIKNNGFTIGSEQWAMPGAVTNSDLDIFEKEIDKKKFFKDSKIENPKISIEFLHKDKAIIYADTVKFVRDTVFGVIILSDLPGLDAAHTGFAVNRKNGGLMFRHASQLKGRVIEEPLSDFLKTTRIKTPGIAFFRFKEEDL